MANFVEDLLCLAFPPGSPDEQRVLVTLAVYLDSSGPENPIPALAVAGALSSPDLWLAFSEEWKGALDDFEHLPFFHMSEYETGKGVYEDWQARGVKYSRFDRLLGIMEKYVRFSVASAIGIDLCKKYYNAKPIEAALGLAATRNFITMPEYVMLGGDPEEKFVYTFEQGEKGWGRLESVYNQIYDDVGLRSQARLGGKLGVERKDFPALQAADILAYEMRKYWSRMTGADPDPKGQKSRYSFERITANIPVDWLVMDEGFLRRWIAVGKS